MVVKSNLLWLPDLVANWPWPRLINPHFEDVKSESSAWFRSFGAFSPRSQYALEKGNFELLASLAYPLASQEHLRTGCDLMSLLFAIDEYTDVESESAVREIVNTVIDAFRNPYKVRPQGEVILGEMARQFWELSIMTASQTSQRHMIDAIIYYLEGVVLQAADRDNSICHTTSSYLETRRRNVGMAPSFVVLELNLDLPDKVFYNRTIASLTENITDLIIFDNDINSYNKEQAVGDDHSNILTVVMNEFCTDLEGAMVKVTQLCTEVKVKFLDGLKELPSWNAEIDCQVQKYIHGLANWARANNCWIFEGGRYFGNRGPEIQSTRVVELLAKVPPPRQDKRLRREAVVVPLVEELETQEN